MTTTRSTAKARRSPTKPAIPTPDELEAAWTRGKRPSKSWTPRPWVSVADRMAFGRAARQAAPRSGQGTVTYTYATNTGASQRTGTLTIAGIAVTVTQAGGTLY